MSDLTTIFPGVYEREEAWNNLNELIAWSQSDWWQRHSSCVSLYVSHYEELWKQPIVEKPEDEEDEWSEDDRDAEEVEYDQEQHGRLSKGLGKLSKRLSEHDDDADEEKVELPPWKRRKPQALYKTK